MNVTAVKESEWNKDGTIVKVTTVSLDDGREAPGYDLPSTPEIGKPLPDGWEVATAKSGKLYIKVPKAGGKGGGFGGGAAAFRNTREGFLLEQESIHRSVALKLAVKSYPSGWQEHATDFYTWLRATANPSQGTTGSSTPTGTTTDKPAPSAGTPRGQSVPQKDSPRRENLGGGMTAADAAAGSEEPVLQNPPSGPCSHPEDSITLLNPAGEPLPRDFWRCLLCGKVAKDS